MIKVALPKGRLLEKVKNLLIESGIKLEEKNDRNYRIRSNVEYLDLHVKKVRAIPQLLSLGLFDLGFVGLDIVKNFNYENLEVLFETGFNPVTLVVAVAKGQEDIVKNPPKRPLVIATEYEQIAHEWAFNRGLAHIVIQTYGSTEGYSPGEADIVFDCIETGETIAANGLTIIDEIVESSTCLIANKETLSCPNKISQLKEFKEILEWNLKKGAVHVF